MSQKIPVGLVGVTGYTGMELARLLCLHPNLNLVRATSRAEAGKLLAEVYPFMQGFSLGDLRISEPDPDDLAASCELVFLAVPHGAAMDMAAKLLAKGLRVVDLSADFRLKDPQVFKTWYAEEHRHPELLSGAVYGLPELYGDRLPTAKLVANPGCYPTSVILGLAPAMRQGLIEPFGIIADSKSGASGAGRKAQAATLFCEVHDSLRAYNLGRHRHTPEMEQELSLLSEVPLTIAFSPHILPIDRGILSTIYARPAELSSLEELHAAYLEAYSEAPWVRVLPLGKLPETRHVRGTMFCDIGLVFDTRTNLVIVVSAIDNLCRGASGQAVANANLMLGLAPSAGLALAPLMP